MLWFI